jgi:hypothetical protein
LYWFSEISSFSTPTGRYTHRGSNDSSRNSETKLFRIEFSDLHVSEEDSAKPRCDQIECQLFEAKHFADEYSVLVPADVAAIVHPP